MSAITMNANSIIVTGLTPAKTVVVAKKPIRKTFAVTVANIKSGTILAKALAMETRIKDRFPVLEDIPTDADEQAIFLSRLESELVLGKKEAKKLSSTAEACLKDIVAYTYAYLAAEADFKVCQPEETDALSTYEELTARSKANDKAVKSCKVKVVSTASSAPTPLSLIAQVSTDESKLTGFKNNVLKLAAAWNGAIKNVGDAETDAIAYRAVNSASTLMATHLVKRISKKGSSAPSKSIAERLVEMEKWINSVDESGHTEAETTAFNGLKTLFSEVKPIHSDACERFTINNLVEDVQAYCEENGLEMKVKIEDIGSASPNMSSPKEKTNASKKVKAPTAKAPKEKKTKKTKVPVL